MNNISLFDSDNLAKANNIRYSIRTKMNIRSYTVSYPMYVLYLLSRISKMCGKCHRMRILIIRIEFSSNFLWQSIKLDVYEEKTDIISAK